MRDIKSWCDGIGPQPEPEHWYREDAGRIMRLVSGAIDQKDKLFLSTSTRKALLKAAPWYLRLIPRLTITPSNVDRVFSFSEEMREVTRCLIEKDFVVWLEVSLPDFTQYHIKPKEEAVYYKSKE